MLDEVKDLDENAIHILDEKYIDLFNNVRKSKPHDLKSVISRRTVFSGKGSIKTSSSKTYITHLEKQIKDEKEARVKLQKDIEEIKRINSEISSKLGLSQGK